MVQAINRKKNAVLLLSGGLDSSVSGIIAMSRYKIIRAITFDYGQLALKNEIKVARLFCKRRNIRHEVIKLDWYKKNLKKLKIKIPNVKFNQLEGSFARKTARAVWLPQRNLLFLSIASAIAEANNAVAVIAGFNAEEGRTFPDNSKKFINAMNNCLNNSSFNKIKIYSPVSGWDKTEILKNGIEKGLSFDEIWSCYRDEKNMCGTCESCQRLKRAILRLNKKGNL